MTDDSKPSQEKTQEQLTQDERAQEQLRLRTWAWTRGLLASAGPPDPHHPLSPEHLLSLDEAATLVEAHWQGQPLAAEFTRLLGRRWNLAPEHVLARLKAQGWHPTERTPEQLERWTGWALWTAGIDPPGTNPDDQTLRPEEHEQLGPARNSSPALRELSARYGWLLRLRPMSSPLHTSSFKEDAWILIREWAHDHGLNTALGSDEENETRQAALEAALLAQGWTLNSEQTVRARLQEARAVIQAEGERARKLMRAARRQELLRMDGEALEEDWRDKADSWAECGVFLMSASPAKLARDPHWSRLRAGLIRRGTWDYPDEHTPALIARHLAGCSPKEARRARQQAYGAPWLATLRQRCARVGARTSWGLEHPEMRQLSDTPPGSSKKRPSGPMIRLTPDPAEQIERELLGAPLGWALATLQRRFGPAASGSDDHKDMGRWVLTTPDPNVILQVRIRSSDHSLKLSSWQWAADCAPTGLTPEELSGWAEGLGRHDLQALSASRPGAGEAARAAALELLRLTTVRDMIFGIDGEQRGLSIKEVRPRRDAPGEHWTLPRGACTPRLTEVAEPHWSAGIGVSLEDLARER